MCTSVCMKGARQQTYGLQETLHAEMSHTLPGASECMGKWGLGPTNFYQIHLPYDKGLADYAPTKFC